MEAVLPQKAMEALAVFLEREPRHLENRADSLFLRAAWHPVLARLPGLTCQQTWRPDYDRLQARGLDVRTDPEGEFDLVLYLGTRQREENLANFARGLRHLRPGGLFLCSMPNDLGAGRFERLLAEAAPLEVTFSKNKSRVFGVVHRDLDEARLQQWGAKGDYRRSEEMGLVTCPGIFGWDKVDAGSRLLAESLPEQMPGTGADLGAGYGYLAVQAARRGARGIHLYEAEKLALDAARQNLEHAEAEFHWRDVTEGVIPQRYDWIVMNAPFHEGRSKRLELGARFVRAAHAGLKPGGVLHMVANRHLPYEVELDECFFERVEKGPERDGFKVLRAWR